MRNALYTLLTFLWMFCTFAVTTFAQDDPIDDRVWSTRMKLDPSTINVDPDYKWVETEHQVRRYFLGTDEITVNPNFRPWPGSNTTQSELSVDVHPLDVNTIFASANATPWPVSGIYGTGVYWSFDGAATWTGFDNPPFGGNSGDPASVIGTNGYFYEGYISSGGGMGVSTSTDNGTTWSSSLADNSSGLDKNHLMVDKVVGSPFEHRLYDAWTPFSGVNDSEIEFNYSTNFGSTWATTVSISDAINAGSHNQGVNIQTGPNGEVYCAWAVYDAWPGGEDAIGFNVSTDGGVTWGTAQRIYSATNFGIRGSLKPTSIRVSSFPSMAVDRSGGPNNGNIYITWPQRNVAPAGSDPDIVMIKSTDGGATWSSPVRVNDDPLNNGKDQYFPWMTVDQSSGQLVFVFYDSRETTNDSSGVWGARSLDGGSTFENFRISDENFKPKPIGGLAGGYQGDYIGIAALDDIAFPYWADDRTGNYQAWMSVVNFGPPCPIDPPSNPNPPSGTIDVPIDLAQLTWDNGAGATMMELWFGEAGNMTLVYDGTLITSWSIPGPLDYSTGYNWRVKSRNDTCTVSGPVWSFTTMPDPNIVIDTLFYDEFESGIGQWTVVNDGGDCVWEIFTSYPNSYTLPPTSSGGVLAADSDECGSGTTMLTTATIVPILDLTLYTDAVIIEFDNDWNVIDSADEAHVEVSTDGGTTWVGVWDQIGTDIRSTHEIVDVTSLLSGQSNVSVRVRSVQPGWDWWWVVDNFIVYGMRIIPVELTSFAADVAGNNVHLNWATATETNNQGFEIQRSNGDNEFQKISFVPGHGTTTDNQVYSFTDGNVSTGSYSYRLKQIDYDGSYEYSDVVVVEVSTPIEYALEQNYPNPFNPGTVIAYSIPQDGLVTLDVYNLLGEKVASLVNEVKEAGRYEVSFDASELASGIYVYTLKSGSFNSVKKMLLMK